MIDFKNELQNYPMIDLDKLSQANPNIPDNIKIQLCFTIKLWRIFAQKARI